MVCQRRYPSYQGKMYPGFAAWLILCPQKTVINSLPESWPKA